MTRFCNAIYFKHMIENALEIYFTVNRSKFTVDENGLIVFSNKVSYNSLKKALKTLIVGEIQKCIKPFDITKREYFFVIGSCYPNENFLLKHLDKNRYFPMKVRKYIENGNIKYFLRVSGIRIDLSYFNSVLEDIFNEFFQRKNFKKFFPSNVENLFFLKKSKFDCYMTYRVLKKFFGRINTCNMFKENESSMKKNLYSVNERIDNYVVGIKQILDTEEMKMEVEEINQYIRDCIGMDMV